MQGNRQPRKGGKIYPRQDAHARDLSPQPDRLPEPYIPTDDQRLQRILLCPLINPLKLLLHLWLKRPYRALPGVDSATATRRRWPAPGGTTRIQTAAHWLRAQLRRLHSEGRIEVQGDADLRGYLPAGLLLLPRRPAAVHLLLTGEEVKRCPSTACVAAPDDLDVDRSWAKVQGRRSEQMALVRCQARTAGLAAVARREVSHA